MKILLTGGAGFIGSHIAEEYLANGHEVFILDKKPEPSFFPKLYKLKPKTSLHYFQFEFPKDNLETIFAKIKPDTISHHAALINVNESIKYPVKYSQTNILFTVKLLELAKTYQTKHFIFPSSSAVYGNCQNYPIFEKEILNPISLYGNDKLTCEYFLNLFSTYFKTTIFRYSNVYGPRQDNSVEGGVVAIFVRNFLNNHTSIIFGKGSQTRDFIFVKDIVKANLLATEKSITGIYNLSSNKEISILELFNKLNQITGKNFKPIFKTKREGDINKSLLDNTLIKQTLHWQLEFDLENGLKQTLNYFKH